jgi:SPP1 gp7 family putative phage head morphogenesis protein
VAHYGSLPFAEALGYLKAKLNLPTQRWDDLLGAAHDRAFVVAGAMQADLLADLHAAVNKVREQGSTLAEFKKEFEKIVTERGWTGWTGEGSKAGRAWRARVIYETNLQTSTAAGRYQQMQAIASRRPYWRYRHNDAVTNPRPEHVAWDGKVLRADDPWWSTHYPPCGFGCRCFVESLSERDVERLGLEPTKGEDMPFNGTVERVSTKTGEVITLPQGVDKGWDYAPGAGVDTALRELVAQKLVGYPPAIAKALSVGLNRWVDATTPITAFVEKVLADGSPADPLWLGFVENFESIQEKTNLDLRGYLVLLPEQAPRHAKKHHQWDGGNQRKIVPADYAQIVQVLSDFDTIKQGEPSRHGQATLVVQKKIGSETYRCVFEVQPGKRARSLALVSMVIKI